MMEKRARYAQATYSTIRSEQQLCPCYKEGQEFQKLVELKDSGLVIYCHRARRENIKQDEAVESTSIDVFILHNKKDTKVTTSELIIGLEQNKITCPRCKKTLEHAQELMQEVKSIKTKIIMGICDHCRRKAKTIKNQFCACDEIVKKFISVKGEQKEDIKKYVKIWLSKMKHLTDGKTLNIPEQLKSRAHSDLQFNRDLNFTTSRHEPEIQQMFYPEKRESILNLNTKTGLKEGHLKQGIVFVQPIEPMETSLAHTPQQGGNINTIISSASLEDFSATFVEARKEDKKTPKPSITDRKQDEIFEKVPSMEAKEALKSRHDLSLRQMMRLEKDSLVPLSVSKRPEIYETPKIAPWEQKEPTSKYHVESETDSKTLTKTKIDREPRDLDHPSKKLVKHGSSRTSENGLRDSNFDPRKVNKSHENKIEKGLYDSKEGPKKDKKMEDSFTTGEKLKLQGRDKTKKKEKHLVKSEPIEPVGMDLKPQFTSLFFSKAKEKKNDQNQAKLATSSHIIKETKEKLRQQAERKKKIQEEERQQKLEQDQMKRLAQEEKTLKAAEKKRQAAKNDEVTEKSEKDLKEKPKPQLEEDDVVKAMKDQLRKQKTKDIEHKVIENVKKDVNEKLESKERKKGTEKGRKELKTESEVPEKDLKAQSAQKYKGMENEQKIKTEKEDQVQKVQRLKEDKQNFKQFDQFQKSEEKSKVAKNKEKLSQEKDTTFKEGRVTEKKLDSSDEIKAQKSISKEKKETSESKDGQTKSEAEFLKLKDEYLKEKEDALKKQNPEFKANKKKGSEEADHKAKEKELELGNVKIKKEGSDLILKLIQIKQAARGPPPPDIKIVKVEPVIYIPPVVHKVHKCQHIQSGQFSSFCSLCEITELELDTLSLDSEKNRSLDKTDIIIGEKIFQRMPQYLEKTKEPEGVTIMFQKDFYVESDQDLKKSPQETARKQNLLTVLLKKKPNETKRERHKGFIHYALSDRTFIEKGWTMLPTEKIVRKVGAYFVLFLTDFPKRRRFSIQPMNIYRMRPAQPEFDWFERNKNKRLMTYDTGERLAEFDDNGRGRWYYRSGRLALDYYDAKETNAHQRFVVYSSGEPDERGRTHPITILATFDYLGNGIVFDHAGKIRLKYNQTEGVVLDRAIGPVSHWQWHSLNDPPVLQQVMIDTQMAHKDPEILKLGTPDDLTTKPVNEEMLAIEFDNFIKEKSKKLSQEFKPYQIKMKAMKINEHFSLKVLDQATVYLIFRDGLTNLKLNIGMILDHQEIVDTDTAEVGEVANNLERFPARTDSLAGLQRSVAHARRYERQHAERERRLRPPEPCASADLMNAAAATPMRLPMRTVPIESSSTTRYCSRKPSNNLYYDSRLLC